MHTAWGWAELLLLKAQEYIEFSISVKFSCGTYHGVTQDFILGAVEQEEEQKVLQGVSSCVQMVRDRRRLWGLTLSLSLRFFWPILRKK